MIYGLCEEIVNVVAIRKLRARGRRPRGSAISGAVALSGGDVGEARRVRVQSGRTTDQAGSRSAYENSLVEVYSVPTSALYNL